MMVLVQVDLRVISVQNNFLREVGFNWSHFTPDSSNLNIDEFGNYEMDNNFSFNTPGFGNWVPVLRDDGRFILSPAFGEGGEPFIGTGIGPSNDGMNLNLGLRLGDSLLTGFFRIAVDRNMGRSLSAPQITCGNGQEASVDISTETSYISTYNEEGGILIPEIDTADASTGMEVRPVVSADRRYVFMELDPTLSTVRFEDRDFTTFVGVEGGDGGASGEAVTNTIEVPITESQDVNTTVGVPDRGTIVVGGLGLVNRNQREGGLPVLSKIPIVRRIFGSERESVDDQSIFVVARPEIVILREQEERFGATPSETGAPGGIAIE
jgi:type II secretory pathway component GspD/PulD (secretin)